MDREETGRAFHNGALTRGHAFFGAHRETRGGQDGWVFRVWAPKAAAVSVVGSFNGWEAGVHPMERWDEFWETFIPGLAQYESYKYAVTGCDSRVRFKCDPYGLPHGNPAGNGQQAVRLKTLSLV